MLPIEAFAEAVAFLHLYDLKALAITNAMCSSLAVKAATKIRWEEFRGLRFCIHNQRIQVFRRTDASGGGALLQPVANLTFASESDMIEFVAAALPNCVFDEVRIFLLPSKHILDAICRAAGSVIIKLLLEGTMNSNESLNVATKFREVKAFRLLRTTTDHEAGETANFYRGSGIQELQYYRSYKATTLTKVALL